MSPRPRRRALSAVLAGTLVASAATVLVGVASAPALAAGPAPVCSATTATCTVSFGLTGATETFPVPAGVTSVELDVAGAEGGPAGYGVGGRGGRTAGALDVSGLSELVVLVGGAGSDGGGRTTGGGGATHGHWSASGGGGSFVFDDRGALLAAAGGGGGAFNDRHAGGAGGGAGQPGGDGVAQNPSFTQAGGGATTSAPGAGGGGGMAHGQGGTGPAAASTPGAGGDGGPYDGYFDGAGGGGGFYGGGGGAPFAAGGGGSGFADPSMTDVVAQSGVRGGHGAVVISWDRPATTTALAVSPAGGSTQGDDVTLTATVSGGSLTPTATVAFTSDGSTLTGCGAVALSSGTASCTTSTLAPGASHDLVATYAGDGALAPSTSSTTSYAVAWKPLDITTTSLPGGTYGEPYSQQLGSSGGDGSTTWSLDPGTLPAGLTLSSGGLLSGTPTAAGPATFSVGVHDGQSPAFADTQVLGVTIARAGQTLGFSSAPADDHVGSTWAPQVSGDHGTGTLTFTTSTGACSASQGAVTLTHVGTCEVTASKAADSNYDGDSATYAFGVLARQTSLAVTLSDTAPAYGHQITASATSSAPGVLQWSFDGQDVGDPVAVEPGTPVEAPELWDSTPPQAGTAWPVTATFVPDAGESTDASSGTAPFTVAKAVSAAGVSVTDDALVATVGNATDGDIGTPTGAVTFLVDGQQVGTAPLVAPQMTMIGAGLLPAAPATASLAHVVPAGPHVVAVQYAGDTNFLADSASTGRDDPVVVATASSPVARSASGWYRTPVTVTFTCTTAGSPLVGACPAPVVVGDGAARSVSRTVLAQDGGSATASVTGISVDTRAPAVRLAGKGRTARCIAVDAGSGVASCTVSRTRTHGRGKVVATATDRAGNVATTAPPSRSGAMLVGAPLALGRYVVVPGASYTVVVWAKQRPRLVSGGTFRGAGKGRWQAVVVVPTTVSGPWRVGVRTRTGTAIVPMTVSR
jgi:hypothetical protein